MNRELDTILDECLAQLKAGASVDECLAAYPEHSQALRPLLTLASAVQAVPIALPDSAAVEANRQRVLAAVRAKAATQPGLRFLPPAGSRRSRPSPASLFARPWVRAAVTLAVLLLVVALSSGGLAIASADSLPGDGLYPVKRAAENVRLSLTLTSAARQRLQTEFAEEREDEVRSVLDERRATRVDFLGPLQELGDGYWIVGGLRVELNDDTEVEGQPIVGAVVVVEASSTGDGRLLALLLWVQADATSPAVTAGLTATEVEAAVSDIPDSDEAVTPDSDEAVTPADTEEPEATDQPQPTETGEPEATEQPQPTETDEPDSDYTPGPEPTKTEEPEVTEQPEPTKPREPEPTDHPEPGKTPGPKPTEEPEPDKTSTAEPTDSSGPSPTETGQPEASHTPGPKPTDDD